MDDDTKKLNLQTVEELILDEDKVLTYMYLSKKLCIHVNESKELLSSFIKKCKASKPPVKTHVNYLISGLVDCNKARNVVCSENDLHRVRGELKSVFFEHIYSVSKGEKAVDGVTLSNVNNFLDFQSCIGLIRSKSCSKHSDTEINNLKSHSHESSLLSFTKTLTSIEQKKKFKQEPAQGINKMSVEVNVKNENQEVNTSKTTSSATRTKTNSQKGISGFFNKQTSKPVQEKHTQEADNKSVISKTKNETEKTIGRVKREEKNTSEISNSSRTKFENKTVNGSAKFIIDKKNARVDKKRKRVLHLSDSESEEDGNNPFANEDCVKETIDSDNEIPLTPRANVVKVTSGVINPKKKRKLVDKVYTDEDGYILTKKEEVYESCSDNDEPVPEVKKEKLVDMKENIIAKIYASPKKDGKRAKKVSPPQKGKQSTLMNFFSKK